MTQNTTNANQLQSLMAITSYIRLGCAPLAFTAASPAACTAAEMSRCGCTLPSRTVLSRIEFDTTNKVSQFRADGMRRVLQFGSLPSDSRVLDLSLWRLLKPSEGRPIPVAVMARGVKGVCKPIDALPAALRPLFVRVNLSNSQAMQGVDFSGGEDTLEDISLSFCESLTALPDLSAFHRLRSLDVSFTKLTSLAAIHNCQSLEEVRVTMCSKMATLNDLGGLPQLREVFALNVSITDLSWVKQCPALKVLMVSSPQLLDTSMLGALPNLRRLGISNSLTSNVDWVQNCHMLEELILSSCKNVTSLTAIAALKHLKVLDANYSGVQDVRGISQCTSLESVKLMGCHLNAESVAELQSLRIKECDL